MRVAGGALVALALLGGVALASAAQDTVVAVARHVLPVDTTRIRPFHRVYDMVVHTRDSGTVIGQREVTLQQGTYAGNPSWRLVEVRTGAVPAAETLYVTPDLRPLLWYAVQREARMGVTFVGDTVLGATSAPAGRRNLLVVSRPDLIVSQPMIELVLPLLPLSLEWTDSAAVLAVDLVGGTVIPVEISVIGEELVVVDSTVQRPVWVVALRADPRAILLWIDKENGEVYKMQQPLPTHVGTLLEYRRRPDAVPPPPGR
jgi:hypothetical protein